MRDANEAKQRQRLEFNQRAAGEDRDDGWRGALPGPQLIAQLMGQHYQELSNAIGEQVQRNVQAVRAMIDRELQYDIEMEKFRLEQKAERRRERLARRGRLTDDISSARSTPVLPRLSMEDSSSSGPRTRTTDASRSFPSEGARDDLALAGSSDQDWDQTPSVPSECIVAVDGRSCWTSSLQPVPVPAGAEPRLSVGPLPLTVPPPPPTEQERRIADLKMRLFKAQGRLGQK